MLRKFFKGEKPDYGLLDEFINRPGIQGEPYRGAREQMYDERIVSQGPAGPSYQARGVYQIPTDKGDRYYFGQTHPFYDKGALRDALRDDAIARYQTYPADSLTTEQFKQFQNYGLFDKWYYLRC